MGGGRVIREVEFAGDHHRRGIRRGQRLRDTLVVREPHGLPAEFVAGCRRAVEEFYPPAVREFEGILEGGGFEPRAMAAHYFARLESQLGGCTMFAVEQERHHSGKGIIVGRNYDWAVEDLRWCELHRYRLPSGMDRLAYTHHWAGSPDVLNEAGLYLAIASLPPEPVTAPGVQWSILVEMISETCETVEEAVGACTQVRHLRPMNYLLADASGGCAVVSAGCRRVSVARPEAGLIAAANSPLSGTVVAEVPPGNFRIAVPAPNNDQEQSAARSRRRVGRALELLEAMREGISAENVKDVLADHEAPICTGNHDRPGGGVWATIWSGIGFPAEGDFRIAPGLPCRHPYHRFIL